VGGDACTSVVVVSATQVTCTLPEKLESGMFDVVATNPIGSATKEAAYEYVETPTVTSISPVTGVLAGGGTLTINGTLLTGTSAVSLGGAACTDISNLSATQVTCTIPSRLTTGTVNLALTATAGPATLTSAYVYTQPAPAIVSVSPTSGPLPGGGTLTINGTDLSLTNSVMLDETECTNIVNVSPTQVTCTIPAGMALGPVQVNVTTAGGYIRSAGAYTYVATPTIAPPIITPTTPATTPPTTPPTTAPTPEPTLEPTPQPTPEPTPTATPAPTPTPIPSAAPHLQLKLDLQVNSPVVGAQAVMTGGGLQAKSTYVLTMRSTPVQVATGLTDDAGNFQAQIRLPSKVCVSGGLHELELTGITPDGHALHDSSWLVLDDNCKTRSVPTAKPVNDTVTLGTFTFPYLSAKLTPHAKSVLRSLRSPLGPAKRVTITGYTQTTKKSKAAKKFNRDLAKRRAAATRVYLLSLGIKAPITIVGAGGVSPLRGKAQKYNRRVVIWVRY
jgi:outer membrane protein OmpA-like peptidoglycan-associated protein